MLKYSEANFTLTPSWGQIGFGRGVQPHPNQVLDQYPLPAECQAAHWFVCPCWATNQVKLLLSFLVMY